MKRAVSVSRLLLLGIFLTNTPTYCSASEKGAKILLLITEQNIKGPQHAWWASEIDLSTTESRLSELLISQDYRVLGLSQITGILRKEKAFRRVGLSEEEALKLAELSRADYVVLGKALASAGANVPHSNMRSCFANATVKVIRVSDAEVVAYLEASGSSVHTDVVTGGKEALLKAAEDLAVKLTSRLDETRFFRKMNGTGERTERGVGKDFPHTFEVTASE